MKTFLVIMLFAVSLMAQSTNPISITFPKGCNLINDKFLISDVNTGRNIEPVTFDGTIRPQTVILGFPGPNPQMTATIYDFPYNPHIFEMGERYTGQYTTLNAGNNNRMATPTPVSVPALMLKSSLKIKVFSMSRPFTNYDAVGNATITPAKRAFKYCPNE